MTNICSYICAKCILYDLLLNCKNVAANMDITTSDKTGIIMAMGFLKGRKTTKLFFIHHKSFYKNIKEFFCVFL